MSNTFAEVFGGYIAKKESRELLACGEVVKIKYREKNKSMEIQTAFPCLLRILFSAKQRRILEKA